MTLEKQVHDLEIRVKKLEQDNRALLLRLENLESKISLKSNTIREDRTNRHSPL